MLVIRFDDDTNDAVHAHGDGEGGDWWWQYYWQDLCGGIGVSSGDGASHHHQLLVTELGYIGSNFNFKDRQTSHHNNFSQQI